MRPSTAERALIVEDDARLSRTLKATLVSWAAEVRSAATAAEASALLGGWRPDLVLLDFKLPDGDALELLREIADSSPAPAVVALSAYATPAQSFELATLGVRTYLEKPVELEQLERALEHALSTPPNVTRAVRQAVGHVGLRELETEVRHTMLEEALSRANGSRRGAAKLLSVSRQLLQHALRLWDRE